MRGYFLFNIALKKHLNASKPPEHPPVRGGEMSKRLGGIIGCKDKTSSWHLIGFPDGGSNIESTVVCPNVTGRTKKRIAQSKRARAGSLALVD